MLSAVIIGTVFLVFAALVASGFFIDHEANRPADDTNTTNNNNNNNNTENLNP